MVIPFSLKSLTHTKENWTKYYTFNEECRIMPRLELCRYTSAKFHKFGRKTKPRGYAIEETVHIHSKY